MDIGYKIKQLRLQKGLTLEELASRCELTKGFLSQLERNLTSPSISTLDDILEVLGSTLSDFFLEEKEEMLLLPSREAVEGAPFLEFRNVSFSYDKIAAGISFNLIIADPEAGASSSCQTIVRMVSSR